MSCLWLCFTKKKVPQKPAILTDQRISNPLNPDECYNDKVTLKHMEAALIDNLVHIHCALETAKKRVAYEFQKGASSSAKDALAKKAMLMEKKKLFEARLARVQAKLKELDSK